MRLPLPPGGRRAARQSRPSRRSAVAAEPPHFGKSQMLPQFDGFGLGLRKPHYQSFVSGSVDVDFVEVISENFMVAGGKPRQVIEAVRSQYPVILHGVSMSLGSADGLDADYLRRLKSLADDVEPLFISDHLSWSRVQGLNTHDLLPLPYTEEALGVVRDNLSRAQDVLGRAMLIENPSSYLVFQSSTMSEWDFLGELCTRTGCGLLLDVNNVFVTCRNQGLDPITYVDGLPLSAVRQIHLAGHSEGNELLIDTHDHAVCDEVWSLYAYAISKLGPVATMIERDDSIPPLDELLDELAIARSSQSQQRRDAA